MVLVDHTLELRQRFESAYKNISSVVVFDSSWSDESGGLSGAVNANLKIGEVSRSSCPDSGRRCILVGTPMDTVIVFEGYPPEKNGSFRLRYNANPLLDRLLGGSYLSIAQFSLVVTDYNVKENIGIFLDKMYLAMKK